MTRSPDERRSARTETISHNAITAFATQLATAAFTAALTIFLTRELGPTEYGVFALAVGVLGLLRPATGGIAQAAGRFVAERHSEVNAIVGVLGMALRWRLWTAALTATALFALAEPIADVYNTPELTWPLRGCAVAFFGQNLVVFCRNMFLALRRATGGFTLVISESAVEFSATVMLVLLGGGAGGAAFGRAIGYVFGAILGIVLLGRFLGRSPLFRTGRSPVERREFTQYAGAMFIVGGASAVYAQMDVLFLGAYLTTTAVGIYSAPVRLLAFLSYPGYAIAQAVGPRLARHTIEGPNLAVLQRALGYVVVVQAGIVAILLVWAEPIIRLTLGSQFLESDEVLRTLLPVVYLGGIGNLLVQPLNYAGEGRSRIPIAVATNFAIAAVAYMILIPSVGILGAAIGSDIAYTFYFGGHLWLACRALGLRLGPLSLSAARGAVAAIGLAGVLWLVGTGELSAVEWCAGFVIGGLVFVGLLVALREFTLAELRSLLAAPVRVLRRT